MKYRNILLCRQFPCRNCRQFIVMTLISIYDVILLFVFRVQRVRLDLSVTQGDQELM